MPNPAVLSVLPVRRDKGARRRRESLPRAYISETDELVLQTRLCVITEAEAIVAVVPVHPGCQRGVKSGMTSPGPLTTLLSTPSRARAPAMAASAVSSTSLVSCQSVAHRQDGHAVHGMTHARTASRRRACSHIPQICLDGHAMWSRWSSSEPVSATDNPPERVSEVGF